MAGILIQPMNYDNEIVSNCCGAFVYDDILICSECKEHCEEMMLCPECGGEAYRASTEYSKDGVTIVLDWDGWECESCGHRFNEE